MRSMARADVVVQNLAPGATTRLGLGARIVRARYPATDHLRHDRLR